MDFNSVYYSLIDTIDTSSVSLEIQCFCHQYCGPYTTIYQLAVGLGTLSQGIYSPSKPISLHTEDSNIRHEICM